MSKSFIKRQLLCISAFIALTLSIASCSGSKNLYSWHKYDDAAYQNNKKQTEKTEKNFVKQITKVIEVQDGVRKVVPPRYLCRVWFLSL